VNAINTGWASFVDGVADERVFYHGDARAGFIAFMRLCHMGIARNAVSAIAVNLLSLG